MLSKPRFKIGDYVQFILDGKLKTGFVVDNLYVPEYKIRIVNSDMGIHLHDEQLIPATKTVVCNSTMRLMLDASEARSHDLERNVKLGIAYNLGKYLFENDFISWKAEPSWEVTKKITGSISVVVGVNHDTA
ncbi:hypothetical protein HCA63_06505 [Listeria booriae]|uniref:hypothetical protein n=1 Tax=Listeria booriae TaxID=1552123 RepID=UPI001629F193|nr:hypothetical protein [Listeria booriae]MBC1888001.1 hypothetical protein [Listeria booriae]